MKKQSFILHFLLFFAIFFYCFMPPILSQTSSEANIFPEYSIVPVLLAFLWSSVGIFAVYTQNHGNSTFSTTGIKHFFVFSSIKFQIKFRKCVKQYKSSLLTFFLIFASGFIISFFETPNDFTIPQKTIFEWIVFFLITCVFACTEEILYRYYLPKTFKYFSIGIFHNKNIAARKFFIAVGEILSILLFALAHRYLGIFAVFHAFISGALLRWNIKKTDTVVSVCLIHCFYNCLIFALYIFFN